MTATAPLALEDILPRAGRRLADGAVVVGHIALVALVCFGFSSGGREASPEPTTVTMATVEAVAGEPAAESVAAPPPEASAEPAPQEETAPEPAKPPPEMAVAALPAPPIETPHRDEAIPPPVETAPAATIVPPRPPVAPPRVERREAKRVRTEAHHEHRPARPAPQATAPVAATAAAATGRTGASVATAGTAEQRASYAAQVSAEINRHKRYPDAARAAGHGGAVGATFRIDASGRIASWSLTRSSGDASIDAEVAHMLSVAHPPPPPGGSFQGAIAVHFDLN